MIRESEDRRKLGGSVRLRKTVVQERRLRKVEGLLDMINSVNVADICAAKAFLNYVQAASEDASRSVQKAEMSDSPHDKQVAQNDVDHFCDVAQKAIDGLLALKIIS